MCHAISSSWSHFYWGPHLVDVRNTVNYPADGHCRYPPDIKYTIPNRGNVGLWSFGMRQCPESHSQRAINPSDIAPIFLGSILLHFVRLIYSDAAMHCSNYGYCQSLLWGILLLLNGSCFLSLQLPPERNTNDSWYLRHPSFCNRIQ